MFLYKKTTLLAFNFLLLLNACGGGGGSSDSDSDGEEVSGKCDPFALPESLAGQVLASFCYRDIYLKGDNYSYIDVFKFEEFDTQTKSGTIQVDRQIFLHNNDGTGCDSKNSAGSETDTIQFTLGNQISIDVFDAGIVVGDYPGYNIDLTSARYGKTFPQIVTVLFPDPFDPRDIEGVELEEIERYSISFGDIDYAGYDGFDSDNPVYKVPSTRPYQLSNDKIYYTEDNQTCVLPEEEEEEDS